MIWLSCQVLAVACLFLAKLVTSVEPPGNLTSEEKHNKHSTGHHPHGLPPWIVTLPPHFTTSSETELNSIRDVREDPVEMKDFHGFHLHAQNNADGETLDAVDHFFWGMKNGTSFEAGALDGSVDTASVTEQLEKHLGWKRILVEADPSYRKDSARKCPTAYYVNAAICKQPMTVHYVNSFLVGGILEFMEPKFMRQFHRQIYSAGQPAGNVSSITDWSRFANVATIQCINIAKILHFVPAVKHIHLMVLDIEGGELEVLKAVPWRKVIIDVICVEVEIKFRPKDYWKHITEFITEKGYVDYAGTIVGKNLWFHRKEFVPSTKPGLRKECFNGDMINRKAWKEYADCNPNPAKSGH